MIDVTCAIIRNEDDEVLVVQRSRESDHPLKWEFPGGKVKKNESDEECIIREIREELSIDIVICGRLSDVVYDYGFRKIRLIPFICDTLDDVPFLTEHVAYKWTSPGDLALVDFSEADIPVAAEYSRKVTGQLPVHDDCRKQVEINEDEIRDMLNRMSGIKEAEWVASSANDNPMLFRKMIEFSFSDDRRLAFHSSWILTKATDREPEKIRPYLPLIVESLEKIDNDSSLRSFLKILSLNDPGILTKKHQGLLADACFRFLNSGSSAIAIKAYSMDILYRLTLIYPELGTELALSVRSVMDIDSAGVASKAKTILRKLNG